MLRELNDRATSRAWSSMASSSGTNNTFQETPVQFTDDQMEMANSQAFQQTAEQAHMTVSIAVGRINKRAGKK
eukprot:6676724-Heterocapsa_arctica.AAC.1